jgi:very-short-patch-repair endonuclease/DNA polymerase III delta prime subunit
MNDLNAQIEAARKNLIDLSMRNRLLHYRAVQSRSIRIVDELPREIFDILVVQEKSMRFRAGKERGDPAEGEHDPGEEVPGLWTPPDVEPSADHTDRYLQTTLDPESLQKRLFRTFHSSRTAEEEQGYSMLFLAVGFLEWDDAGEGRRAPLILIPVRLQRTTVRKSFSVEWTGAEILSNISLKEKLREQGVELPDAVQPERRQDIDAYFGQVRNAIVGQPDWKILNEVVLDFFSFAKFVMYRDLDPASWPATKAPSTHPLLRATLDPDFAASYTPEFAGQVDPSLQAGEAFQIMDADPFQTKVIEDAKAGHNLAVEGPPGTGKSQTIANIIAELLGAGKSVLFVSEKMAALEVVKSRLDRCSLGDFCLELHSRKANKRDVLRELERSMKPEALPEAGRSEDQLMLEQVADELDSYARSLREPIGALRRSPYELFEMREQALRITIGESRALPHITINNAESITADSLKEIRGWIAALSEMMRLVVPVVEHPWRGCTPGMILPVDQGEVTALIEQCRSAFVAMNTEMSRLCALTGMPEVDSCGALNRLLQAAGIIANAQAIPTEVLRNPLWEQGTDTANLLIVDLNDVQRRVEFCMARFKTKSMNVNVGPAVDEFRLLVPGSLRFLNSRYRKVKQSLRGLYRIEPPANDAALIADCDHLAACVRARKELLEKKEMAAGIFGPQWKGDGTRVETLRSFVDWMVRFKQASREGLMTAESETRIASGVDKPAIEKAIKEAVQALDFFNAQTAALASRIGLDMPSAFGVDRDTITFPQFSSRFQLWLNEIDALPRWSQYSTARSDCANTAAAPLIPLVDADRILPHELDSCFVVNFVDALLRVAFTTLPALTQFVGSLHEQKIDLFAKLDRRRIQSNRQRLATVLRSRRPAIVESPAEHSEAGILLGELGRKRGHLPIRQLLLRAGRLIRSIKPCFMMSPLSISQFLDPESVHFDAVIIDEASQMRPEDALGALLRGKQLIVMGDTRQLPPTNFFEYLTETEDVVDAGVSEIESILHQCKRVFPTRQLNWHYRSRHESLIAVPNREFYDSSLMFFPSAIDTADHLGLQFVHVVDSSYDRGGTSVNRGEARVVARAALDHYRQYPETSLGVGTLNIRQQQAVQEEIELLLREEPEMEEFFSDGRNEHFFVKNLETIQGDERDVIFISVGFGFDDDHRLSLQFGPLNQDGGHRRLNVLITRAREECVVFANFRGTDMHIDDDAAPGVRALKTFLEFASDRSRLPASGQGEKVPSGFLETLYDVLVVNGYDVRRNVGSASFRVDLGIVDPALPGSFVLGIECDGPKYHGSVAVGERDRLREEVLTSLGWHIHRVWSVDWYRDRNATEARLLQAAANAVARKTAPRVAGAPDPRQQRPGVPEEEAAPEAVDAPTLESLVTPYLDCTDPGVTPSGELRDERPPKVASVIERIVNVEGPVHVTEVIKRIRMFWGVGKGGARISRLLEESIDLAITCDYVVRRGDFLWMPDNTRAPVRSRSNPDIDLICDEEIAEAIALVLRHQFSTRPADLIVQASRLLGFRATRESVSSRIAIVINNLVQSGLLVAQASGNIGFTT